MFVVDTSESTDADATLAESKNAIKALDRQAAGGHAVRAVAAGSDALVVQRFTTDQAAFEKQLAGCRRKATVRCGRASCAARSMITDMPAMVGSMVLVTDGNTGTGTPFSDAKGAVIAAGATVVLVRRAETASSAAKRIDARRRDRRCLPRDRRRRRTSPGSMTSVVPQLARLYHVHLRVGDDRTASTT